MNELEPRWVDTALSRLLRGGVLLSIAIVTIGIVVTFVHHPEYFSSRPSLGTLTQPGAHFPSSISNVLSGVRDLSGQAIVMAGLLLLIATPVARVAFSILIFVIEHDRLYTLITAAVLIILLIGFATGAAGADLPPIPPLPPGSWPTAASAEPFARALIAQVPPSELARTLHEKPELIPPVLRNLGTALMSENDRLARYVGEVARSTPADDLARLAAIIMIDPLRYGEDAGFHQRINALIPRTFALLPRAEMLALLDASTPLTSVDFDVIDGRKRHIPFNSSLQMPDDCSPIAASIYSLHSSFFSAEEVKRFLSAVHNASPKRKLIVLADAPMKKALRRADSRSAHEPAKSRLYVTFVDTWSRPFTPWPRDPFIVARNSSGRVVFVNRPNVQAKREEDQNMSRAIVQQWDDARWTVAPIAFHNGNILLTPSTVWISIHTLEPRVLALLGLDHVPTETFNDAAAVARYLSVIQAAARELQRFYRRPVRFVHPVAASPELMQRLSGGAGFDLDSVVTILPNGNALVGDTNLGLTVARQADWSAVQREYKLKGDVIVAQSASKVIPLQQFLNEVAGELQRDGMTVHRLPLLNIPASLLAQEGIPEGFEFLMTWNNVVIEKRRAEGFASLLAAGDELARKTFAAAGYRLHLFPPLVRSIVLGGGYRCASNHLRQ